MIIVTLGEPLSVNVELIAKLFSQYQPRQPTILVGSHWHFRDQLGRGSGVSQLSYEQVADRLPDQPGLYFKDIGAAATRPAETLAVRDRGEIANRALDLAVKLASDLDRVAVVTCPIDKSNCVAAGFDFSGQTEFFETRWGGRALMILAGPRLVVGLVTGHIGLAQVADQCRPELVVHKAKLLADFLTTRTSRAPRIAVCGLNPHCGDNGLFGQEELAIRQAIDASTLELDMISADTAFFHAWQGTYDGVLAMFHDQGLAPFKLVHFHDGVNITHGLKHLRVSPDHGPAADLFLLGEASIRSLQASVQIAENYFS